MPINEAKLYTYKPDQKGPVFMKTFNLTGSGGEFGGTFFKSKTIGVETNQIKIGLYQDGSEAIFVEMYDLIKEDENIFGDPLLAQSVVLTELSLNWNEVIKITSENGKWNAKLYSIRWQIAPPPSGTPAEVITQLGIVTPGKLFIAPGKAAFILKSLPIENTILELRPRTHRTTLVTSAITDATTNMVTQGWDISALRATDKKWVKMPVLPTNPPDALVLSAFEMVNLYGGSGLPLFPIGMNQGPDRTLAHVNYGELEDCSLGILNYVYEWVGSSSTKGTWERYY